MASRKRQQKRRQSRKQKGGSAWQHTVGVYGGVGEQKAMPDSNVIASKMAGGKSFFGGELDKEAMLESFKHWWAGEPKMAFDDKIKKLSNGVTSSDEVTFKLNDKNIVASKDGENINIMVCSKDTVNECINDLNIEDEVSDPNADGTNAADTNAAGTNAADTNAADTNAADTNAADTNAAGTNVTDSNAAKGGRNILSGLLSGLNKSRRRRKSRKSRKSRRSRGRKSRR